MQYNAFISYRHSELDMYVAKRIHKKLETFRVPRAVAEMTGKKSIERVFRDQEELPIGSDLGDNIRNALRESEYLIVICSPRTVDSYWVQTEIETFIELHGRDHILAVLIEGEPDEAFPQALLVDEDGNAVEPLAADVRGATRREVKRKLKTEIVRLAAPLLGCSYDNLRQRHRERRLKKALFALTAIAALAVAFGAYSVHNTMMIRKNYQEKQINQSRYLARTSLSLLDSGDRVTAGLIALCALPGEDNDRPYVADAQYALTQALDPYANGNIIKKDRFLKHDLPVKDMRYSADGTKLITVDQGENVSVWDVESGELLAREESELKEDGYVDSIFSAAYTKDEQLVISSETGLRAVDLKGKELWRTETSYNSGGDIDSEGNLAVQIHLDSVEFFQTPDGEKLGEMNALDGTSYMSEYRFSSDGSRFAVAVYPEDEKNGEIDVCDLDSLQVTRIETARPYILEAVFSTDGNLVVAECKEEAIMQFALDPSEIVVEKLDIATGKSIWKQEVDARLWEANCILKSRSYTDEQGTEHNEVILALGESVYTWEEGNGELCSQCGTSSQISDMLLSEENAFAFLMEQSGMLNICNLANGEVYDDYAVAVGENVRQVLQQNGILAARSASSPDVLLMKYRKGEGMQKLGEYEGGISEIQVSPKEDYYAVNTYAAYGTDSCFYQTKDDRQVGTWSPGEESAILESFFIDEETYVGIGSMGKLYYYEFLTGEEQILRPKRGMGVTEYSLSGDKKYVIFHDTDGYCVVDIQAREIQKEQNTEEEVMCGEFSPDGKYFYGNLSDKSIVRLDTETGKCQQMGEEICYADMGSGKKKIYAVAPDGKYMAAACTDKKVRIFDTEKMTVAEEIDFIGSSSCYLGFFDDSNRLLMQGDTGYIYVYDIQKQEYVYLSDEQIPEIQQIYSDKENGTVALQALGELLILNGADARPLACVEGGMAFLPQQSLVFSHYGSVLYRFPYWSLEDLLAEAKRQFGDSVLSEQERRRYNID